MLQSQDNHPYQTLLGRHAATPKHAMKFLRAKSTPKLDDLYKLLQKQTLQVKQSVQLPGFFCRVHADLLIDVMKKVISGSEIVTKCTLK